MGDKSYSDTRYRLPCEGSGARCENEVEIQTIDDQSAIVLQQNDVGRNFNSPDCVLDAVKYMM